MSGADSLPESHPHPLRSNPVLLEDIPEYLPLQQYCPSTTSTDKFSQAQRQSLLDNPVPELRIASIEIFPCRRYDYQPPFSPSYSFTNPDLESMPSTPNTPCHSTFRHRQQHSPPSPSPLRRQLRLSASQPALYSTQHSQFSDDNRDHEHYSPSIYNFDARIHSSPNLLSSTPVPSPPPSKFNLNSSPDANAIKRLLTLNANLAGLQHEYTILLQSTLNNNNSNDSSTLTSRRHKKSTLRRLFTRTNAVLTVEEIQGRLRWIGEWKRVVGDVVQGLGSVVGVIGREHHDDKNEEWKGERLVEDGERFVAWMRR